MHCKKIRHVKPLYAYLLVNLEKEVSLLIKKLSVLSLTLILVMFFIQPNLSYGFSKGKPDPSAPPGTWYIGDAPQVKTGSPILFVHGLTGSASTWFEPNDMYKKAQDAGHPTAFINLYPDQSYWDNGEMLANKLKEMYDHFGEKIVIVGHSKGGVDTQTALLHYDAEQYVEEVFTLGTPHHGSQLANLAYSNWAGWLAGIIGMRSPGTDSLRTGTMAHFRNQTDQLVSANSVPFQTLSGRSWGSFGTSLYFGGLYLSGYGKNDGAVTVDSSRLSYANEFASLSLDHYAIAEGHRVFHYLQPQLANEIEKADSSSSDTGMIVRGGELAGETVQSFQLEKDIDKVTFSVLAHEKMPAMQLVSPDGVETSIQATEKEHAQSMFAGAYSHFIELDQPESGTWTLEMNSATEGGFVAIATIEGGLSADYQTEDDVAQAFDADPSDVMYSIHINDQLQIENESVDSVHSFQLPAAKNASQTITTDYEGVTEDGTPFERTVIEHIYVDNKGNIFD